MEDESQNDSQSVKQSDPIMSLAASPKKGSKTSAAEKSKVYLKRHQLYTELSKVHINGDLSFCMQQIEDLLRNKFRSVEEIRNLRAEQLRELGIDKPSQFLFGGGFQTQHEHAAS